jgi:tyrosyl-tRNA synthetase
MGNRPEFNLLVGRALRPNTEAPVHHDDALLEVPDGVEKMSVEEITSRHRPLNDMFGKLMSISDELMWKYYDLLRKALKLKSPYCVPRREQG